MLLVKHQTRTHALAVLLNIRCEVRNFGENFPALAAPTEYLNHEITIFTNSIFHAPTYAIAIPLHLYPTN